MFKAGQEISFWFYINQLNPKSGNNNPAINADVIVSTILNIFVVKTGFIKFHKYLSKKKTI